MSAGALDTPRTDHTNMRSVLALVDDLLDSIEAGLTPNFVLLANALYYMRKFPGQVHHPKEDLIFKLLCARDPTAIDEVSYARDEHKEIAETEDWLVELVLDAPRPGTTARQRMLEFGRRYIETQNRHSEREERLLFPRAQAALTDQDWAEVAAQFKQIDDPVFGLHGQDRYETLYRHLMQRTSSHP
ncbi:MAG: hemerythrin domain-containing protein [Gammaproteobacteria bacterium]